MANENPYLTITLTGRPPVKIKKEDWPIIACASDNDRHGAQQGNQSDRETKCLLKVRQHDDGRVIVHAIYDHDTLWQNEKSLALRGGELLDKDADIPAAVERVADVIAARLPDRARESADVFRRLTQECIADLPAVEI